MKQKSIGLFAATFLSLGLISAGSAEAITFNLHWTGQTLGYQVKGSFSYDENQVDGDGIVREDDLTSFDIAFIDPDGNIFQEFFDNHLNSPDFNFNFDTNTKQILQTGAWDADNGISIGGERGEGVNFFSAPDSMAELFPDDDDPSPHVHLTDWANEFPDLPEGFTRGVRPHLDIAFFTRTRAEVLDDPNAGEELGQTLMATQVPEPTGILGLGMLGLSALWVKKKST
ncbi:PEP-CTERM sorting domain-containing protein [Cyanothece sp. BG0011]|uniref:PEP-CTERM sorting domain-containing protein n=1 Tax=Cyanothece sp. BG0011 TaxID=2082950 RepID=UPI000D1E6CF4|nr:PEP-CTERM sorting domain-containing protein [Cyanothece sp. BG0011]